MSAFVLTCPACKTRYQADPSSIGNGRTVRCAKCHETWFVPPIILPDRDGVDPDALALADNEAAQQATTQAALDTSKSFGKQKSEPVKAPSAPQRSLDEQAETPTEPASSFSPPTDSGPTVGVDAMMRDLADERKLARRRRTIRIIWAIPAILVVVAAIIAWFNRQEIVNRYPQMAELYQAVGIEVRAGGLEMDPPRAKNLIKDGTPVLRVESTIRNLTSKSLPVPLIELTVHDSAGQDLAQWYVETQPGVIEPRGSLSFTTDYDDPPENGVGVRYRLAYNPG